MNSDMVKPEKFGHLHLVYHFTVPLTNIFRLNIILHHMTVGYQKIKRILQKQNYHLWILRINIYKIIKTLDINKAHGHEEVFIRMLKQCDKRIVKPLSIIFKNCKHKKSNVPIHKKGEKGLIKNYRSVSLLLIFRKIFKRLIFNPLFQYIDENELLNPNQSGFRPFDSCLNQLLSINHEIFSNFDCAHQRLYVQYS